MACFVVSTVAAVGVGVARHIVKHHEKKVDPTKVEPIEYKFGSETKWSTRLGFLELLLLGGSFLLAGEHILHGEVTPYPPFLTAAGEGPDAVAEMFKEMGTVGVAMLGALVVAWVAAMLIIDAVKYRKHKKQIAVEEAK